MTLRDTLQDEHSVHAVFFALPERWETDQHIKGKNLGDTLSTDWKETLTIPAVDLAYCYNFLSTLTQARALAMHTLV